MGYAALRLPTYFTSEGARDNYRQGLATQISDFNKLPSSEQSAEDKIKNVIIPSAQIAFAGKVPIAPRAPSQAAPIREANAEEMSNSSKKRQLINANRSVKT